MVDCVFVYDIVCVPDRDSTVSVDVLHCLNICIQLWVAVQISSTTPLQQEKPNTLHVCLDVFRILKYLEYISCKRNSKFLNYNNW